MALVVNDRVKETSTTAGTGTFTLDGAVTGFETFSSAIGNGNTTYYAIEIPNTTEFEVGLGTVAAGTLARTTVISSSNSDSLVNFSAGTKNVFCTLPASKAVIKDASGNIPIDANKTIEFGDSGETISGDGTAITVASSEDITLDAASEINLDAGANAILFKDTGLDFGSVFNVSSNFVLQARIQDKDLIFKGDDGGSVITALTLDMSEAGAATFNAGITATTGTISGDLTVDTNTLHVDSSNNRVGINTTSPTQALTIDGGNLAKIQFLGGGFQSIYYGDSGSATAAFVHYDHSSDNYQVDVSGTITLDAPTSIKLSDNGTQFGQLEDSSNDFVISSVVSDKDLIFKGNDGGSTITALTFDMSEAGAATFNDKVILGANKVIEFGDAAENIFGNGTDLAINSSGKIFLDANSAGEVHIQDNNTTLIKFFQFSNFVTLESTVVDKDFHIRGNDGGSTINALSFDMSEAGAATFNDKIILGANKVIEFGDAGETISGDGTDLTISASSAMLIDVGTTLTLDGATQIALSDSGTNYGAFSTASNAFRMTSQISDNDILFRGNDGGSFFTALTLDMSEAGAATFNDKVILGANKSIEFGDAGENISGDGTDLTIASSNKIILNADGAGQVFFKDGGTNLAKLFVSSQVFTLETIVSDGDFAIKGNDGGSSVTALTLDMSEAGDATFNSNIFLGDNKKANFGAGNDLQIYHDGTQSIIEDAGTGQLKILAENTLYLGSTTGSEKYISAIKNGKVDLSYDNAIKLETTATGIDVTGTAVTDGLTVAGNVSVDGGTIKLDGNFPTGTNNVAMGDNTLNSLTTGQDNTCIGHDTGTALQDGSDNTFIGESAGAAMTSGNTNTAVGGSALKAAASVSNTVAIGQDAGLILTSGDRNTFVGRTAGSTANGGNNNICLGYNAEPSSASINNEITLGDAQVDRFRIPGLQSGASSGDVLTYDGTKIVLSTPSTGVSAGFAVAMAIAL